MQRSYVLGLMFVLAAAIGRPASAQADRAAPRAHGAEAERRQFPSHVFQLRAHQPPAVQLTFHFGLIQPIVMRGFNAAVDVRYKRLLLSYSHGHGLDASRFVTARERAADMSLA